MSDIKFLKQYFSSLKELIDEKLLGKVVKKDEELEEKVGTFNKIMDKIKAVLK